MSSMLRQPSHSSSLSNSTASPKSGSGFKFFKKRSSTVGTLRDDHGSSDKIYEPQSSDKIPTSPLFSLPDLDLSRSHSGLPSPDSFVAATHDSEYLHLRENIRKLRKPPFGPDPKKVDAVWEVYKKFRDESLQLCSSLLQKSRKESLMLPRQQLNEMWVCDNGHRRLTIVPIPENNGRNTSLESNVGPLDTRSSNSASITETALPFQVNDQWLAAIHEYKAVQESMLENIRASLVATYKLYEPEATERQIEAFLNDKNLRKTLILKWRDESIHRMKSEKLLFWEQYKIRSLNYDRLRLDLKAVEKLFGEAQEGEAPNMLIREHVIAKNGDTILEFANGGSEIHPILRFRVSSHLLAAASPLFAQFLSTQKPENTPLDMMNQLPPAQPARYKCKDGMEVKVYRMPQVELNKHDSLVILLHAAHMHTSKVPRQVDFPVFVSIAEVCLKYHCTSPLELQVEYQWLPEWIHLIGDDNIDGFLIISYAFGLRRIFTRMSKSAILNAVDEEEIRSKEHWPPAVRDKIIATRAAKLAQVQECCTKAMGEYFRSPAKSTDRSSSVGSLQLTSLPRCPRSSHLCDATNLGWVMLVYNELRILPMIMKDVGFLDLPAAPKRSLKELVDCLRLMPSAPSVHSGVCDYAAAFRSDINDIYNSVQGLTLRDVAGRNGWALSKHAGPTEDRYDDLARDLVELEAPLEYSKETKRSEALSNEDINLRILSHLEDMNDLNAAAMIDKTFYQAYKRNEASLLKNVMKAERRRTMSQLCADPTAIRQPVRGEDPWPSRPSVSIPPAVEHKSLAVDKTKFPSQASTARENLNDLYDASPVFSPVSPLPYDELPMSEEEAQKILWPDDEPSTSSSKAPSMNGNVRETTEKFLLGQVSHIEDKARMFEDDKHLRDEKDQALGLGIYKR
ncbi:uncharacterized protein LY89DRAFT_740825 [Mollisia scopiformis]|uniref:BTB domain-containing protein n=1 Tax=Mollisia scopiformis TaxID=149040 RepID=A0A132BBW1_MOLSC|nr:uncharacterized protein LY89DRAFT_740825 [Mollisia scopiformis]KUJ09753.1 hypothetical protein LY89DRAFT_740825 [Mollisia scopiformis]